MTGGTLPVELAEAMVQLSAPAWRLRKQAVEVLCAYVGRVESDDLVLAALVERLLSRLANPDTIDGRAAAHDVLVAIGPGCVAALSVRLASPGPGTRMLVDLLGVVGDDSHVAQLVELLTQADSDDNLRAAAATALGTLGGETAEAALCRLLRTESDMLRVYALDALRSAVAAVPVSEIEPLLGASVTRVGAVTLLGLCGELTALPLLVTLLDDGMAGVRAAAVSALVALEASLPSRAGVVASLLMGLGERTRSHVRALIADPDPDVRGAAIRLAGLSADALAIEPVLAVMDDPMVLERAFDMVVALGAAAAPALATAAEVVDASGRESLFRLVGALPLGAAPRSLTDAMVAALDEPDEEAALGAAEALQAIGDRGALAGLYRAMVAPGRLGETAADALTAVMVREEAHHADLEFIVGTAWPQSGALAQNLCRVVGKLGDPQFVSQLVAVLGSPDVGVRVAAATALGNLPGEHEGASALSFTLADEEPQVRAAACRSLGRLRAMSACQSLISATNDGSPMVRAAAVAALVNLDNPVNLARLRAIIVEDPVPTVVVQAIAGLGHSALEQDLTMLMSLCLSKDHEVVKAAARGLGSFSVHRATAALLGLLGHARWDVRWAAAEVLADRRDVTALGPLRALAAQESDEHVRRVIEQALVSLGSTEVEP
ncbi:MAG: HEAT repeat domain-containing protein [Nannocystaceae bacterium]|nr:HEAT repeat domain-containing protein [Nannocystaceae bacterium]